MNTFQATEAYSLYLDELDELNHWRHHFYFPQHNGKDVVYLCGNSLGLQPKTVEQHLQRELEQWKTHAVEGHFKGEMPWMYYHHFFTDALAALVGALPSEVVLMNTLTTNLHLLMVSFYRPTPQRYKIIVEAGAFPSDQYAFETQARFHGFDPHSTIIELQPRTGEHTLHTDDILHTIQQHADSLALVLLGGVNYYTGQYFDIPTITRAAHQAGAIAGFDLAHTAGNLPLQLHDWNVDFAVWCSYKYLNSGPGGPAGAFVHQRHANNPELPRFGGWWGHNEKERFLMKKGFIPMEGAAGWQLSNAQIFAMAPHKASLDIFHAVGMPALRKKSLQLTAYLQYLLDQLNAQGANLQTITPRNPNERGAQLSILTGSNGKKLHQQLLNQGVISDWREPNVIRVAPVPLYNSFYDLFQFYEILQKNL